LNELGGVKAVEKAIADIDALQAKVVEVEEKLNALGGVIGAQAAIKLARDFESALKGK